MSSVNNFQGGFQKLWSLIKASKSDEGFIKNVVERLIPFLQNCDEIQEEIVFWNQKLTQEGKLLEYAYRELSDAASEILQKASNDLYVVQRIEEILEDIRKSGSCQGLKECPYPYEIAYYRLKPIYADKVADSIDFTFAPITFQLMRKRDPDVIGVNNDTHPIHLWKQLLSLKKYWSYREECNNIWWSRVEGNGLELWLKAHDVRFEAFSRMIAGMLHCVDLHGFDKYYFDREYFYWLIERLFQELILILPEKHRIKGEDDSQVHMSEIHWRTRNHEMDSETLMPKAKEYWKKEILEKSQDPEKVTNKTIQKLLKQYVEKTKIYLRKPSNNLYLQVVRDASPRIYENGKFIGLKPDFL